MTHTEAGPGLRRLAQQEPVYRRLHPWWFDFATAEVVRSADGQRWRVEDVTPMNVRGEVDVEAVDRWVLGQPGLDPPAPPADPARDRTRLTEYGRAVKGG